MEPTPVESPFFIEGIELSRKAWDALVEAIPPDEMDRTGFCGDWSLADVLIHIMWYEEEMIKLLRSHVFAGSDLWALPTSERNAIIVTESRGREIFALLDASRQTFSELNGLLHELTEEELNDPAQFPGMPEEWQPWQVIASNTYEHYDDHSVHARAWLGVEDSRDGLKEGGNAS